MVAPTKPKPSSNVRAVSAGPTSARSYRRQPSGHLKQEGGDYDADTVSDTTHESHPPSSIKPSTETETISSRRNDFSERSWWMVDLDSYDGEGSSNQGATALVQRCMRVHDWDLAKSRKILSAYRQFLALKKTLGDWDASLLSPCHLVDQMWHQHILDNFNYYHDVMLLCGHFVGHNPDGALDLDGKVRRDRFTRECLRQHFGSYDVEVWDGVGMNGEIVSANPARSTNGNQANIGAGKNKGGVLANAGNTNGCNSNDDANDNHDHDEAKFINSCGNMWKTQKDAVGNTTGCLAKKTAAGNGGMGHVDNSNAGDPRITIRVKDQNGEETMFKIRRSTRMSVVFCTYATRKGVATHALRFLLDGKKLAGPETAATLDLEDEDQIDVMLNMCGC